MPMTAEGEIAVGKAGKEALRVDCDGSIKLEFHGPKVTAEVGMPPWRPSAPATVVPPIIGADVGAKGPNIVIGASAGGRYNTQQAGWRRSQASSSGDPESWRCLDLSRNRKVRCE